MTMVPAAHQNLSRRHQHHHQQDQQEDIIIIQGDYCQTPESFGSHMSPFESCYYSNYGHRRLCDLESDLVALGGRRRIGHHQQHMAEEDESRTSSSFNDKTGSSSKDFHDEQRDHESWLQLRIGNDSSGGNNDGRFDITPPPQRGRGLVELDLLPTTPPPPPRPILPPPPPRPPIFHLPQFQSPPSRPVAGFMSGNTSSASGSSSSSSSSSPWMFLQQQHYYQQQQQQQGSSSSTNPYFIYPPPQQQQDNSCGFIRPVMSMTHQNYNIPFGIGSFPARPPHHQIQQGGIGMMDVRRPSVGVRLIDTPRRPHSGVWFMLQASPTQSKEPFLPQISKSYLRIKDGKMTVRLLMKYLVNKLALDSESEVEITCRGQQLLPFLTLQHVRDNLWSQRDAITLLPDSSTMDHLMVLQYGRTSA